MKHGVIDWASVRRWSASIALRALLFIAVCPVSHAQEHQRIVVTSSYIIEIVVALGVADRLVGVGAGSDHIREVSDLPKLPGYRQVSAEGILSLRPSHVILGGEGQPAEVITQIESAGVEVHVLGDVATQEGIEDRIEKIGALVNKSSEAAELIAEFRKDLDDAKRTIARAKTKPRGLFILSGGGRPTVVAGRNTSPGQLLDLVGVENVGAVFEGFKPMGQEAMIAAAPDFILTNKEGLELSGGDPVAMSSPGAKLTPAGRSGAIFSIPSKYLQGFGLITPEAIRVLGSLLHPELKTVISQ